MFGITTTKDAADWDDVRVLQASQSQPWLFALIVERYEAPFLRKAKRIIYNPLDAEEVVQDAFTKIYVHAAKYEPQSGASFSSWAYRILMNTAFTRYQKLSKEGERFTAIDPEYEQFIGAPQEHVAFNTRQDGIERVLKRLPKHFAYVLRLHYLERWPQEDIARETGEKVGTVKARIHRAKAAFRAEASDEEIASIM
jgi:RNA polymerase sigma-70 factor (ECF subfamily)